MSLPLTHRHTHTHSSYPHALSLSLVFTAVTYSHRKVCGCTEQQQRQQSSLMPKLYNSFALLLLYTMRARSLLAIAALALFAVFALFTFNQHWNIKFNLFSRLVVLVVLRLWLRFINCCLNQAFFMSIAWPSINYSLCVWHWNNSRLVCECVCVCGNTSSRLRLNCFCLPESSISVAVCCCCCFELSVWWTERQHFSDWQGDLCTAPELPSFFVAHFAACLSKPDEFHWVRLAVACMWLVQRVYFAF